MTINIIAYHTPNAAPPIGGEAYTVMICEGWALFLILSDLNKIVVTF